MKRVLLLISCLLLITQTTFAQSLIHGRVTDERSDGISDATIKVKGKTQGAITDNSGNFIIKANDGDI